VLNLINHNKIQNKMSFLFDLCAIPISKNSSSIE
jgi:hypothetical protein